MKVSGSTWRVAHGHEVAAVVTIAGHEAVAVIDLDEIPVTGAFARPGHDAGCDCDHFSACLGSEVEALVEGAVARERVLARAEVRRDEALAHRTPLGVNLVTKLARDQHILKCCKLCTAQVDPFLEVAQQAREIGDLRGDAALPLFGAAGGRRGVEIEFP